MAEAETRPQAALFYVDPQPLNFNQHGGWRLKDGDAAFSQGALGVPLVYGEFGDAARSFPILFASGPEGGPIALTGVDNHNVFVKDGRWEDLTYIPAYVRRYPFGFVNIGEIEAGELALAIDAACPRFAQGGTDGVALFENDQPSQLAKDAMEFCQAYAVESQRTRDFRDALRAKGLMVERRVDGTLPDGQKFGVEGFEIVDVQKLGELDAETVVEWHKRGWLAAVYYHLMSLNRIGDLIARKAKLSPAASGAEAANS